jgi:lysophospholipase L1-like esterase
MIGTNDCIDNADVTNAPARLGALIDSIYAQLPTVMLVVAQIIPSRENVPLGDQSGLTARIQTYNAAIPALIQTRANAGKHIQLVDMYTPFAPTKADLMADEWHPNLAGYVVIGTQWYNAISTYLR